MSDFQQEIAATFARSTAALQATTASERAAAVKAAKAEIEAITERELHRLNRLRVGVEQRSLRTREELAERAEATRRELATAIVGEVFASGPESLANMIAKWRSEPSRQLTLAIRERWDVLNTRALAELGEPVGDHVLSAVFVDLVTADMPSGLVQLSREGFGCHQKAIHAAATFRRAVAPDEAESALKALEGHLVTAAQRSVGQVVEPHHVERAALRRQHATTRDLTVAHAEFDAKQRQANHERMVAEYVAPARPSLSHRVLGWLSPGE